MARYVVLSFEDNAQAETFAQLVYESGDQEVVGLIAKPTQFCDSSDDHLKGKGKTGRGFTRGLKYGWWVCAVCKKPTKGWCAGWKAVVSDGKNLLPEFLEGLGDHNGDGT